jgi:uncharacterized ferritin-like protein (DUF455 family)
MTLPAAKPELRQLALEALLQPDPQQKVLLAHSLQAQAATLSIAARLSIVPPAGLPGCPAWPKLRSHLDVPKRSPFTPAGLAALLHAVTHIEFKPIKAVLILGISAGDLKIRLMQNICHKGTNRGGGSNGEKIASQARA